VVSTEDVVEAAKAVGLDEAAAQVVIKRAGSNEVALRRLKAKRERLEKGALKQHEDRLADERAERARQRHERGRAKDRAAREALRGRQTLNVRLAACIQRAGTLAGLGTGSIAGGQRRTQEGSAPPAARNDVADFYMVRLRALIGNFERELDAEISGAAGAAESADERDRRIVRDYEGWASYEVATFDRSVGSPDTVERARRKHGRMPSRGYRPPEEVVA
jgi:hypothetical protein